MDFSCRSKFGDVIGAFLERRLSIRPRDVVGVGLAPLSRQAVLCSVEAQGQYQGQVNVIGGSTIDKGNATWSAIASALYDEIAEELYLVPDAQRFQMGAVDALALPYKGGTYSVVVVWKVSGFPVAKWKALRAARIATPGIDPRLIELRTLRWVPLGSSPPDIGPYAAQAIAAVTKRARSYVGKLQCHVELMMKPSMRSSISYLTV